MTYTAVLRIKNRMCTTSLGIQWLEIHLSMQGNGFNPGSGTKMPHAVRQLNLKAATTKPTHAGDCAPQQRSHHEKPADHD